MVKSKIIDGKKEAGLLLDRLKKKVEVLKNRYRVVPGLAVALVGNDPASEVYVGHKMRKAKEIGVNIEKFLFPENVSERMLEAKLNNINNAQKFNGIIIQLPLPKHLDSFKILNLIKPEKDVDGFTNHNVGLLHSGHDGLQPCTPRGILKLIKKYLGTNLSGKKAVVVGRSHIVGRPMSSLLLSENCSITTLHSRSLDIEEECKSADILISAVGKKGLINANMVKKGACVIDVGIQRINNKLTGDVDFENVEKVAGLITPVPGGVGPMTVACLLENTIMAACQQKDIDYKDLK